MPDLSLLMIVAVFAVIWIEFYPKRLDSPVYFLLHGITWLSVLLLGLGWLPAPAGWAFVVLGISGLYWDWRRYGRKLNWAPLKGFVSSVAGTISCQAVRARQTIDRFAARRAAARGAAGPDEPSPRPASRHWCLILTALFLVIMSPVAAAPLSVVLSAILTGIELVTQGGAATAIEQDGVLKFTLGQAYVVLFSSLHVLATRPLLGVPLLLATGLTGAAFVLRREYKARRLLLAIVAVGAIYPMFYVLADLSGWLGTGMFN